MECAYIYINKVPYRLVIWRHGRIQHLQSVVPIVLAKGGDVFLPPPPPVGERPQHVLGELGTLSARNVNDEAMIADLVGRVSGPHHSVGRYLVAALVSVLTMHPATALGERLLRHARTRLIRGQYPTGPRRHVRLLVLLEAPIVLDHGSVSVLQTGSIQPGIGGVLARDVLERHEPLAHKGLGTPAR